MKKLYLLLSICSLILFGCSKEKSSPEKPVLSSQKSLLTFGFTKSDNPNLIADAEGKIEGSNITIKVSKNTDVSQLIASFSASPLAKVKVSSALQENHVTSNTYISSLVFSVVAEDGSSASYTVSVVRSDESVEPLIKSQWETFTYPYNAYFPNNVVTKNTINGHEGNACGPTALAKILYCLKYPVNGVGQIDFTDPWGLHYVCDLSTLNLDYSNMPSKLGANDAEAKYKDVAKLLLAAGAAGYYVKIYAGTVESGLVPGLIQYFKLDPGLHLVNRWEVTKNEWINVFKTELLAGRPLLIAGRTTTSPAPGEPGNVSGHWFNVDGFNSQGQFHVTYNYGKIEGYFDADDLGGVYTSYNQAIVGFKAKP